MRGSWEDLLGDPDVHLDAEGEAVELIRRWVFPGPIDAVLSCDRFVYLTPPEFQS